MLPTGQVDVASLRSLLRFHVASGTDGLCILGTTGEASLMDLQERKSILEIAVQEVKGKIPILVGTGAIDPRHVKEMILQAIDMGCDASLLVSPMYIKPPQRGLVQFYTQMADLGLPIVMYNVPGRTGVDIKPETVALCAQHDNIVGVKEATGDVTRVGAIRSLTKDLNKRFLLYSGDDATEAEFVLKGGDGCISVTANCAPRAMHDMMMACLRRDEKEAMRINGDLEMLHKRIFCESNPIPAKWAVHRMGKIPFAYCRPPLMELDPQYYAHVEEALRLAKLI
jgi:4-hydroxy-tetrahydrodipicolinate synthase